MRRFLFTWLVISFLAICHSQSRSGPQMYVDPPTTDVELLKEKLHVAVAKKALAAAQAKAAVYKEQVVAFGRQAADARESATEARWTALYVCTVPIVVLLFLGVQTVRRRGEDRERIRRDMQTTLAPALRQDVDRFVVSAKESLQLAVEEAKQGLEAKADELRHDRAGILDGIRILFYRQAYDSKAEGAWGRAVLFTINALVAEFEAAELFNDPARFRYAQVALSNHGRLLVDHVEDYGKDTEEAWWDTRDLEQIRKLKRYATADVLEALNRLESYTVQSIEKLSGTTA